MTRQQTTAVRHGVSRLTEHDVYLFKQGTHYGLYDKLGAHVMEHEGEAGVLFSVWAPNAKAVSVVAEFNGWDTAAHPLAVRWDESGVWEGFVPGVGRGARYKYHIRSSHGGYEVEKADPFAFACECPPLTASVVWDLEHAWDDDGWMAGRGARNALDAPMSVYEVHLGSWRRKWEEGGRSLSYRELAVELAEYVSGMGFTHVELLPVMEHPFYGSWGYQTTGYFAPSARFGDPQGLMVLIQELHKAGVGVLLDWVPSHFPTDNHGLIFFDGTHLYEHQDVRKGHHPDWDSAIFNYGRNEVRSFLISNGLFWLDKYHADGLRVDAVASMLYLDYSREDGQWEPNEQGGRENLEAIALIKDLNSAVYARFPDALTVAEESTAWPMVSRPTYLGGLGFGMKWNMGWMHDTLAYFSKDPIHRRYHHSQLTFSIMYAFSENFMLPLSHDEVVHGKGSLLGKMAGDDWRRFAGLRLLLGYMWGHPGKKLLFMGADVGQRSEWDHESSVDWALLGLPAHQGVNRWLADLNAAYRVEPALWQLDFSHEGFQWIDCNDADNSVLAFLRRDADGAPVAVVCNFTPVPRNGYCIGLPQAGEWAEVLNSDAEVYGGAGWGNLGRVTAQEEPRHGLPCSAAINLPPLGMLLLRPVASAGL